MEDAEDGGDKGNNTGGELGDHDWEKMGGQQQAEPASEIAHHDLKKQAYPQQLAAQEVLPLEKQPAEPNSPQSDALDSVQSPPQSQVHQSQPQNSQPQDSKIQSPQAHSQVDSTTTELTQADPHATAPPHRHTIETLLHTFIQYHGQHRTICVSFRTVVGNMGEQIDRRKAGKYGWFRMVKQYFGQYMGLARTFHEGCYRGYREEATATDAANKYINIGEELKEGGFYLNDLRKEMGNEFKRINTLIESRIVMELETVFNKYISEMNQAQAVFAERKKQMQQLEEQFRKRSEKTTRLYNRSREGKNEDEDVFLWTCGFVRLEKSYREGLVGWARSLIELRKAAILNEIRLNNQFQSVLNLFKGSLANNHDHNQGQQQEIEQEQKKYQLVRESQHEVKQFYKYARLCTLADIDYVKYALEATKIAATQVQDPIFEKFLSLPHFEATVGDPSLLLQDMVTNQFELKNQNEYLVNTISGNLVYYNKATSEEKDKFKIKHLTASIIAEGVVQFQEVMPGILFKQNRTIRLAFKTQQQAEQLMHLLQVHSKNKQ